MKAPALLAVLATVTMLTAGCSAAEGGADSTSATESTVGKPVGKPSGEDGMAMDMGSRAEPSEPASMICGAEIRQAVRRTFGLTDAPSSTPSWSQSDRVFSCTYRLPRGELALSVQDATDTKQGRAYFDRLRDRLTGATSIDGMENFGFPAFQTSSGNVVFLKDGKTLRVDASMLTDAALPQGYSRDESAYSIASAVIACWTE